MAKKTIQEINEKIKKGKVVVVTAEEIIDIVKKRGVKKAAQEVDVVTTATFGPMCSSGMYINIEATKPRIKLGGGEVYLNDVLAYPGFAARDIMIGAASLSKNDPKNIAGLGEFKYGGGYVIEDFVSGKNIKLEAVAYGTDCYPAKELRTLININKINEAVLLNFRNCYQNYNVAVNLNKKKTLYTYMGVLKPNLGNANYCSAGTLSPLLNDPYCRTIGVGTRIFLGGGIGYVYWHGTQHNTKVERTKKGIPLRPSATLAVFGDLKQMKSEWLRGVSFLGYGVSLMVGIGVPIPILDEEMINFTSIEEKDIYAPIVDYSKDYPNAQPDILGIVSYEQLRSGEIKIKNKTIPTGSLSSYAKARAIADILKGWIKKGKFQLTVPTFNCFSSEPYRK